MYRYVYVCVFKVVVESLIDSKCTGVYRIRWLDGCVVCSMYAVVSEANQIQQVYTDAADAMGSSILCISTWEDVAIGIGVSVNTLCACAHGDISRLFHVIYIIIQLCTFGRCSRKTI